MPISVQALLAKIPQVFAWLLSIRTVRNLDKEVLLRLLRRGICVHDIGANEGYYTRLFADVVGRRGHVHAFEPVPPTFARLSHAVETRRNVTLHQLALGDRCEPVRLTVPGQDFGQASMVPHHSGSWTNAASRDTFEVPMSTIDDVVESGAAGVPDLIKIDVEGAEHLVLQGAAATIRRHHPILFLEVFAEWTRQYRYTPVDLIRRVADLGYQDPFIVGETGVHRLTPPATDDDWPTRAPVNVVCIPPTPFGRACLGRLAGLHVSQPRDAPGAATPS